MKSALACVLILVGGVVVAGCREDDAGASTAQAQSTPGPTASPAVKPVAVSVVAVDPAAKTITVREITAVPAPPGKPVEVILPVPEAATGQKLADTKAGEEVNVTCVIKPTVHPQAGVPVVLTDCLEVVRIDRR
jgi:hypothetical protein